MQTDTDIPGISCGLVGSSVFEWEVVLMMSEEQDSLYGGESRQGQQRGYQKAARSDKPATRAGRLEIWTLLGYPAVEGFVTSCGVYRRNTS
jgi:hypothetical protein